MSLNEKPTYVYWIHLAEHTDIKTQGYVGITTKPVSKRFSDHCRKARKQPTFLIHQAINKYGAENLVVDTICVTSREHAKWTELQLRPEDFIGWNMRRGGALPADIPKELRLVYAKKAAETRERLGLNRRGPDHHNWKGGCTSYLRKLSGPVPIEEVVAKRQATLKRKFESGWQWPKPKKESVLLAAESHKRFFEKHGWWANSQTNHNLWLNAGRIFILRAKVALSKTLISEIIGEKPASIANVVSKFTSGWEPLKDERWINYYEQNKKEGDPTIEELILHLSDE
jgi:hypothetical protein